MVGSARYFFKVRRDELTSGVAELDFDFSRTIRSAQSLLNTVNVIGSAPCSFPVMLSKLLLLKQLFLALRTQYQ